MEMLSGVWPGPWGPQSWLPAGLPHAEAAAMEGQWVRVQPLPAPVQGDSAGVFSWRPSMQAGIHVAARQPGFLQG